MLTKQRYKIHSAHGVYPAGTECWVWRTAEHPAVLNLEFDDGVVLNMFGGYYAKGLEEPAPRHRNPFEKLHDDIRNEIDCEMIEKYGSNE